MLASRNEGNLQTVAKLCRQLGSDAAYMVCDVAVEEDCKY